MTFKPPFETEWTFEELRLLEAGLPWVEVVAREFMYAIDEEPRAFHQAIETPKGQIYPVTNSLGKFYLWNSNEDKIKYGACFVSEVDVAWVLLGGELK